MEDILKVMVENLVENKDAITITKSEEKKNTFTAPKVISLRESFSKTPPTEFTADTMPTMIPTTNSTEKHITVFL